MNKDYVQINPPAHLNHQFNPHASPTKSFSGRPTMDEINGSDYVCMSGGTLSKKLQQVSNPLPPPPPPQQQQQYSSQIVQLTAKNEKSPVAPPIDLKTNYTTPANELPQAQYSTSANQQTADAIAAAKQSVNINNLSSNSPATVSPTPSNLSSGSGKSMLNFRKSFSSRVTKNIFFLCFNVFTVKFKNLLPYSVTSRPGKINPFADDQSDFLKLIIKSLFL